MSMRVVTITRDMKPYRAGQDAVLPDEVAAKLIASGAASNPRPFPPPDVAPAIPVDGKPILKLARPYFTRKKKGDE
jgi:hypothetical protein